MRVFLITLTLVPLVAISFGFGYYLGPLGYIPAAALGYVVGDRVLGPLLYGDL